LQPTEGDARRSHTLRVGRYAQHFVDALQMDENPVEYLLRKYPEACPGQSRIAYQSSIKLLDHK
jgi:ATPase subunit of ABC transporter with duplicated ATPase domains